MLLISNSEGVNAAVVANAAVESLGEDQPVIDSVETTTAVGRVTESLGRD